MTAAEHYIHRVVNRIPAGLPLRQQVAMELRALIAERLERGQPIEQVLLQLGDPEVLAESYLAALPLVSATFWPRAGAKILDWAVPAAAVGVGLLLLRASSGQGDAWSVLRAIGLIVSVLALALTPVYFVVAECVWGQTLGKRAFNLRVVRESGGRISLGQSVVRQLPLVLSVWMIDVIFALFTERSQRAFEMLSKTRCVRA